MTTTALTDLLSGSSASSKNENIVASNGTIGPVLQESHCTLHGVKLKPLRDLKELTPTWLSLFLNRKIEEEGFSYAPTGTGQMSNTFRVKFRDEDHPGETQQLIVKFARNDPDTRDLGIRFGHYQREAVFYRRFGDRLQAGLPHCYGAIVDKEAWFTLVLEDLGLYDCYQGAQLEGCDYKHARLALSTLAKLQAPVLGDAQLDHDEWLNPPPSMDQRLFNECLPIFRTRQKLTDEQEHLLDLLAEDGRLDDWWATREGPYCIFHGDFRLDNILFLAKDGHRAVAVDWGSDTWDSPMRDVAYFLGNGLTLENRRLWEKDLVREYLDELNKLSKVQMSWEHAWKEYRLQSIYGLAQHIPAAAICAPTERGERMFYTLASRQAQHALDMDAISLIKPRQAFHAPAVGDEAEHVPPPDAGPLWSESWYFDAAAADGSCGMYARIGRLPNQNCCNFIAGIFQEGKPPITIVDMQAPLPETDQAVQHIRTDHFNVRSECLVPLKKFSFNLAGAGKAHRDPAAPMRGEDVADQVGNIKVELMWETAETPYKKLGQTRYEIPCRVSGQINIDEQILRFDQAPGQRNHSWGIRNWWVADWVWSGLHFLDGSHIFTIALGKGKDSTGASGYIQQNGSLIEITSVTNDFVWQDNGLPGKLILSVQPGDLTIECEPVSAVGLRLMDPEGREAHLPRVLCRAKTSSQLVGVGWLDFNRVYRRDPKGK